MGMPSDVPAWSRLNLREYGFGMLGQHLGCHCAPWRALRLYHFSFSFSPFRHAAPAQRERARVAVSVLCGCQRAGHHHHHQVERAPPSRR